MKSPPLAAAVLGLALAAALPSRADVLHTSDGRKLEGKILSEDPSGVRIDARVGGTRVILRVERVNIQNVEKKPLPAGFFDPPPADERAPQARAPREGEALYLEVPVVGAIGQQVLAEGIIRSLAYARRHGVAHVVFFIDSAGGDTDEASAIYRAIRSGREGLKLHAVIKKCQGAALAPAVWCDTVHFLPGGVLGGEVILPPSTPGEKKDAPEEPGDQEIFWAQLAFRVVRDTGKTEMPAAIVRALLDPAESLSGWKDEQGALRTGPTPPAGLAAEKVIFRCERGQVLRLTQEQVAQLGMPPVQSTAELGSILGLAGWASEGPYAADTMQKLAADKEKKARAAEAIFEEKVKKNLSRREDADKFVEHNLQEAAKWDPTKGTYDTYAKHWNWGWGWSAAATNSNQWTEDSRARWRTRSDASIHYLTQTVKGLTRLKSLDEEAVKLGLTPTLKKGEAERWIADLKVKIAALRAHRDRKGE